MGRGPEIAFWNFFQQVEIAKVPDIYTLTILKAEVEKMEKHVQGWIDLSKK